MVIVIDYTEQIDASGVICSDYPRMNHAIVAAILLGYCSTTMIMLLGQNRVFLSMDRDRLLSSFFSHIHEKFCTPA